jgi:putative ABC transport system substrate-binding protein
MAADILSGKAKPQDMPIQSQKEFNIIINEENAKKIGLTIPKEILDKAAK